MDQLVSGVGPLTVRHDYDESGIYTMRVVAVDKDGGTSAPVTRIITIVPMEVQPDPVDPAHWALVVGGTTGPDVLLVISGVPGAVTVLLNGSSTQWSDIHRVIAYGQAGDDILVVSASFLPVWLFGDDGNDILFGGFANDLLSGGAGADGLNGFYGDDILLGGTGIDVLFGGFGDDLLLGATTAFDSDATALAAIAREWNSGHSYETRIANLRGDNTSPTFGERLNAGYFLRTSGPEATVFDDQAVDILFGQDGRDWFFVNPDGPVADWFWHPDLDEWLEKLK